MGCYSRYVAGITWRGFCNGCAIVRELEWSALALLARGFKGSVRFGGGGMLLCRERVSLGLPPEGEAKKDGALTGLLKYLPFDSGHQFSKRWNRSITQGLFSLPDRCHGWGLGLIRMTERTELSGVSFSH